MRLHLRPLGVSQNESFHPKLESQTSFPWNPESQQTLEHDPEKWIPVFRKDPAQTNSWSRMIFRRKIVLRSPFRHTPDAERRYPEAPRSCQIAVFMRNGTFYKGSR
jgi:hypothetical protein